MSSTEKNSNNKNAISLALSGAFAEIDKKFGKGSVMVLGDKPIEEIETIPTGSIFLDQALGVGGLPRGRIIEIFGAESSGKTTLTLHAIAQAQKIGGVCAFIDAEHSLDPVYARKLGVKVEDLVVSQPESGEQALEITEVLIRSGAIDVLVVDSVAALVPKAELEGEMGDSHMGLQARLMSQALRKLTAIVHKSKTILIFINQVRQKINSMPFGPKETTTGGVALKFYSSVRLEVKRIGALKKGDTNIGNRVAIKIVKNKVSPPFTFAEIDLLFDRGISKERELMEIGLIKGLFKQSGAWISFKGEKFSQGKDACVERLREEPAVCEEILEVVKKEGLALRDGSKDLSDNSEN